MQAGMYKIGGIIHKYELINTDKFAKKHSNFQFVGFDSMCLTSVLLWCPVCHL